MEKKWQIESQKKAGLEEAFVIKTWLDSGELGRALEHRLGYYYVQSLSSMLPSKILLSDSSNFIKQLVLDCCAAPGSKTTHLSMLMKNNGLITANDVSWKRNIALIINLQRCGVINTITTSIPIQILTKKFIDTNIKFDYVLADVPCSNEGSIRKDLNIMKMWTKEKIKYNSKQQKSILSNVLKLLKNNGVLVYSTCTLNVRENEEVIDYVLKKFPIKLEKIKMNIKTRIPILKFKEKTFNKEIKKAVRIWPMDFDSEGFFIAKIKMER